MISVTKIILNFFPFFMFYYGLGVERLCPVMPDMMLLIPCNSSPIERNITIKTRVKPGYAYKIADKAIKIPPMMIFAIRELFLSFFDTIPFATNPTP